MKGRAIDWLPEELAWIEARSDWPRKQLHAAFVFRFMRADVSLGSIAALCKRKGWLTGRTGQFEKGVRRPDNPARKGWTAPGSEKGWFKKGGKPHTYRGAGHESVDSKDGYVWLIVNERNPYTGADTRRVMKHRWLWEQLNGPIPAGHVLKCLDGNKLNTDPSNWQAVPRGLLPRLNGKSGRDYDTAPPELQPTILAIAKLEHAAREAKRARR